MEVEKENPYIDLQAALVVLAHTYNGHHYAAYKAAIAIISSCSTSSTTITSSSTVGHPTPSLPDIRIFLVEVTLLRLVPEIERAMSLTWHRHSPNGTNVFWLPLIETLSGNLKMVPVSPGRLG